MNPAERIFDRSGAGIGEQRLVEREQPLVKLMCARAVTGEAGGLELSAKRWRDIGGNRDAPRPARGIEGQCHIVVAAQLDKVREIGRASCRERVGQYV